ncbi:MAG: dienelactone hydrolase family protein [Candidatus Kryptonium sp.]|nr:dienelactone hydrolase family protein [Candidatus Kryptonium sp.]MCX7762031.1 dienelactone hydrolase family protein [Candidatus Kryptonium sp.]MDW8108365.1 dienelactone hydrolase family protein [Candidatus Kryptonium sp.]
MFDKIFLLLVIAMILSVIFTILAFTQEKKLNVETRMVKFKSGDEEVSAFLAVPKIKGKFPAIILIHEWWGLTDWEKENATRFASQGYVAIAVDLYRGKLAKTPEEARSYMQSLSLNTVIRDIKSTLEYLKSRNDVIPDKVGIIGWCMGGGFALRSLIEIPDLAAGVICYGRLVEDEQQLEKINAPILGIFAEKDRGIPTDAVKNFEEKMKKLGKKIEVKIYPDVNHAFMNPNNKNNYDEISTKNAWDLIDKFFKKNLKNDK